MRQYTDDQRMEKYLHLHITLHTITFLCLEVLRYKAFFLLLLIGCTLHLRNRSEQDIHIYV